MGTHVRFSISELQEYEMPLSCDLPRRVKGTWSFDGKVTLPFSLLYSQIVVWIYCICSSWGIPVLIFPRMPVILPGSYLQLPVKIWPQDHYTVLILNSSEHEIHLLIKGKMVKKKRFLML